LRPLFHLINYGILFLRNSSVLYLGIKLIE
jgi:hypothetical protein